MSKSGGPYLNIKSGPYEGHCLFHVTSYELQVASYKLLSYKLRVTRHDIQA